MPVPLGRGRSRDRRSLSVLLGTRRRHDARSERPDQKQSWQVCQDAAYELIEFPDPAAPRHLAGQIAGSARRVGLCFEQQMLAGDSRKVPRTTRRILDRILDEAQR